MAARSNVATAVVALQGAAGQTAVVAAAGAGLRVYVVGYYLTADAAGTLKFESASTALTGVMVATTAGLKDAAPDSYLFRTAANEALNITTVTSKAAGYVRYYIAE
jgi:ABC-type branched-subunit amino acid transport system substrate-binding protein